MNNEPVAWMLTDRVVSSVPIEGAIPLYTNTSQELNDGGEPVKNATYWKRQYNEMSALNDRLKSSLYHANEQIKYLEFHPADLTDEEINPAPTLEEIIKWQEERITKLEKENEALNHLCFEFGILRKEQEK